MKNLKTKSVNAVICWNGLRNTPPRDFSSVDEMEKTGDILEALKESSPKLTEVLLEGERLNNDIQTGKIKQADIQKAREDFQKRANEIESDDGEKEVEISFEDDVFNTFFQQFERFGKNWFQKLTLYLSFRKDLNKTNQQPKEKK